MRSLSVRRRSLSLLCLAGLGWSFAACADAGTTQGSTDGGSSGSSDSGGSTPQTDAGKPDASTAAKFTIGGTVTGLTGSVVLVNNDGDALTVNKDGSFTFPTSIASGAKYAVTVKTQPASPKQTCTVTGGTGTVGSANVTTVVVNCAADKFTVGGTVSGLSGTVVLQNNGGDDINVSANGAFAFPKTIASGGAYAVTVKTNPSNPKTQTCVVTPGTGSGNVGSANVTTVVVTCTTEKFKVGGSVAGLDGTLVLQNNAGNDLTLTANGAFSFSTMIDSGSAYAVTVKSQPQWQKCDLTKASGTVGAGAVTDVAITCANTKAFGVDADTLADFEFEDDVLDATAAKRDLVEMNGPHTFGVGRYGKGVTFSKATRQGLDWSTYAALLVHPFTMEMVYSPNAGAPSYQRLFAFNPASDVGFYQHGTAFEAYPSPSVGNGLLLPAAWHYLALVSTSTTTMDVWIDGTMVGNTNMQFTAPPAAAVFFRDDGTSELLDGVVDALRISKVARSAAEIGATWTRVMP